MSNREELVRQFLRSESGYDAEATGATGARFADGAPAAASIAEDISTLMIQLTVAAAASLDVKLFKASSSGSEALPAQLTSPVGETYRDVVRYVMANPSQIRGVTLSSNENPETGGPVLASMKLIPFRETPFGLSCSNQILVQNSQTSGDFRVNMTQVPFTYALDGFNFLQITSGANPHAAATIVTLSFQIGARLEAVRGLPAARPIANRPGGLGPIAVR